MNRKSYNRVVKQHSDALYRYALKFCGDPTGAQDVVQESFLKLWKGRKGVDANKAKGWLFRTAHNGMINQWKRDRRMQGMDTVTDEPGYRQTFRFELADVIEKALKSLPALQKSILLLRDLEGYSYKEIGEMLELSDSQVRVYLFRARKKMKMEIQSMDKVQ